MSYIAILLSVILLSHKKILIKSCQLWKHGWTLRVLVQFSRSVMSDSLRPHELQHARPPCPSPTSRVHPNPCLLSWWHHPTISSSLVPLSSSPQSFPTSGSFQMSQVFASDGRSIGVSASASVLPMNTQDWSPLGWTGWLSLQSKGLSRVEGIMLSEISKMENYKHCMIPLMCEIF